MAFESLTERLQGVFKNIRGKKKLSEKDVQEVTKEIRLTLLFRSLRHLSNVFVNVLLVMKSLIRSTQHNKSLKSLTKN